MGYALGKDYCVFCLAGYMAFFSVTGIFAGRPDLWRLARADPRVAARLAMIVVLVLSAGVGFGSFQETAEALYNLGILAGWRAPADRGR